MKIKFTVAAVSIFLLLTGVSHAQSSDRAQVMLFGVFHFANPGLDVVKTDTINVMSDESQKYLEDLSLRLREFQPTVVLLEFNPANESTMQERYERYLDGQYELPANEIYQIGFRIARLSGVKKIASFDEASIGWNAEPLFEYLPEHDPDTERAVELAIERSTVDQQQAHSTLALGELLKMTNDPDQDRINKSFYLLTNHVGTDDIYVGADATASWWHRNFRMYAKIQRHATPGQRVLVIGGQGHTAVLREFLDIDPDRDSVDPLPFL
jgi:hypothetical protein